MPLMTVYCFLDNDAAASAPDTAPFRWVAHRHLPHRQPGHYGLLFARVASVAAPGVRPRKHKFIQRKGWHTGDLSILSTVVQKQKPYEIRSRQYEVRALPQQSCPWRHP